MSLWNVVIRLSTWSSLILNCIIILWGVYIPINWNINCFWIFMRDLTERFSSQEETILCIFYILGLTSVFVIVIRYCKIWIFGFKEYKKQLCQLFRKLLRFINIGMKSNILKMLLGSVKIFCNSCISNMMMLCVWWNYEVE